MVLSRGVWTIWFFRYPDKTGPWSIGQKAVPRNLTKARTINIMLKARAPKGHRPVLRVTHWPLSSPSAYPCSYHSSGPDVPERTTFSNMSVKISSFFYEPHKSLSKVTHKVFPGSVPSEFPWPPLGVIPHWSEQLMSLGSPPAFPHYPCHPTSIEPTFQHIRYALIMP